MQGRDDWAEDLSGQRMGAGAGGRLFLLDGGRGWRLGLSGGHGGVISGFGLEQRAVDEVAGMA